MNNQSSCFVSAQLMAPETSFLGDDFLSITAAFNHLSTRLSGISVEAAAVFLRLVRQREPVMAGVEHSPLVDAGENPEGVAFLREARIINADDVGNRLALTLTARGNTLAAEVSELFAGGPLPSQA